MFDIERVDLTDFRSFNGTHTFTPPKAPGLYCLTGDNRLNPRMGANGTGKTTLLEAVYWCLYGRTSRGLKAGDVVAWGSKGCKVTATVTVADTTYVIIRAQSPNSLTIDGTPVAQDAVEATLRIGPEAFTYAVMLPQFGEAFFDLAPAAKLSLFSQIMGLDYWLEKSKAADDLSRECLQAKQQQEQALARCTGQLDNTKHDIQELAQQQGAFADGQAAAIKGLKAELKQLNQNDLSPQLKDAQKLLANAESKLLAVTERAKTAEVARDGLTALQAALGKLSGLGATCPTCLQNVPEAHLKAERSTLKTQISQLEAKLKQLGDPGAEIRTVRRNCTDYETEVRAIERKQHDLSIKGRELATTIALETERANPYTRMLKAKEASVVELRTQIKKLKADIDTTNEDHAAVSYWVAGFKRVRLFIVEETLRQLELEVNNNLASLGLVDWHVEFDVERENKSGGITKGFVVFVHAPGHDEPVRFEAYSGGETQRLRMAGDLGLANLIMERAGLSSTIEFFDEPSKHLSQEGLLDMAETLYQRAMSSGKRILLVDHHAIDFGDFAGVITVVKDDKGSHIT